MASPAKIGRTTALTELTPSSEVVVDVEFAIVKRVAALQSSPDIATIRGVCLLISFEEMNLNPKGWSRIKLFPSRTNKSNDKSERQRALINAGRT